MVGLMRALGPKRVRPDVFLQYVAEFTDLTRPPFPNLSMTHRLYLFSTKIWWMTWKAGSERLRIFWMRPCLTKNLPKSRGVARSAR